MKRVIFLFVLLALCSCKGSGGGSSESDLSYSSLLGYWMVDAQDTTCKTEGSISYRPLYSFSEQDGTKVFLLGNFLYTSPDCSGTFVGMQAVGYTPTINKDDVSFDYENELFIITDSTFLANANSSSFCGINNWVLGEFQSIQGTVCSGNPPSTFMWGDVRANSSTLSYKDTDGSRVTVYRAPEKNNFSILNDQSYRFVEKSEIDQQFFFEIENLLKNSGLIIF